MTISYGFYNSVAGDRVYDAIQMSRIFDGIILDGVYAALGDYFLVTENGTPDMSVLVGAGRAWFNHTWTYNDADVALTVPTASPLLPRIDVVYLEVNEDTAVRANKVDILEGTPASSPVAPALTNTTTVHQYPLAHIYVGVSVTSITQANITNKVGTAETPFVTCPLEYVTTNELLAEWEADWLEWFDAIKDQLSTEAETNLQAQIWDLAGVASGAPPYATDMVELVAHDHSASPFDQIPAGGLETGAVTEGKIATGAVTNTKLGDNSVTAAKIAAGQVGNSELATNSVSLAKMQDNSVDTNELVDDSVTNAKIAANAVGVAQIIDSSVTTAKISDTTAYWYIPATAMYEAGTFGKDLNTAHVEYKFPYDSTISLVASLPIPYEWDAGSGGVTPFVVWNCQNSGGVRWVLQFDEIYESSLVGSGTTIGVTITSPNSNYWQVDSMGANASLDGGTRRIFSFRLLRDHDHAGDTAAGDAKFLGLLFQANHER